MNGQGVAGSPFNATKRLRIALIGSRGIPASYSGFETFYEELGVRLAGRGHAVTVYNRTHHVRYPGRSYRGVKLVRLPSIQTKHLDTITHALVSMLHAIAAGHDIYYVCIVGNSPICLLPQLLGRAVILNVDGRDADREKWRGVAKTYIRFAERTAAKYLDTLIADARVIAQRYREEFGRETYFIPYGANIRPRAEFTRDSDLLARYRLDPDRYILFVSRLTPENGAHLLIEAFTRTRLPLKLVIVGDAPYVDDYKRHLATLCDERIVMTGYLFGDDYREISSRCRFFVLPAGIDGTRPVLLDQMGFGNCVLVKDTPANVEVIGGAGASFDHRREVAALREQLERLSGDDAAVQQYRSRALDRVRTAYSWDRVTDQYEALFTAVLARSLRRRAAV
jgi:glycosyltransferase involved in cell wall biosynthesis